MFKKILIISSLILMACGSTPKPAAVVVPPQQVTQVPAAPQQPKEVVMIKQNGKTNKATWSISFPSTYSVMPDKSTQDCITLSDNNSMMGFCGEESADSLQEFTDVAVMGFMMKGMQPAKIISGKVAGRDANAILFINNTRSRCLILVLFTTGQDRYSVVYAGPLDTTHKDMFEKVVDSVEVSDPVQSSPKTKKPAKK